MNGLDDDVPVVLTPRQIIGVLSLCESPMVQRLIGSLDATPKSAIHEALERLAPAVGQTYTKKEN